VLSQVGAAVTQGPVLAYNLANKGSCVRRAERLAEEQTSARVKMGSGGWFLATHTLLCGAQGSTLSKAQVNI